MQIVANSCYTIYYMSVFVVFLKSVRDSSNVSLLGYNTRVYILLSPTFGLIRAIFICILGSVAPFAI